VLRAIRSGRLKNSLIFVDGIAQIADADLADREWAANTDLSRAPGYVKERANGSAAGESVTGEPVASPRVTPGRRNGAAGRVSALTEASTNEKTWKWRLAELEYRERAGELLVEKEYVARGAEVATRVRTKLLGLPSRIKGRLPELTLAHVAVIDEEIRAILTELADGSLLRQ